MTNGFTKLQNMKRRDGRGRELMVLVLGLCLLLEGQPTPIKSGSPDTDIYCLAPQLSLTQTVLRQSFFFPQRNVWAVNPHGVRGRAGRQESYMAAREAAFVDFMRRTGGRFTWSVAGEYSFSQENKWAMREGSFYASFVAGLLVFPFRIHKDWLARHVVLTPEESEVIDINKFVMEMLKNSYDAIVSLSDPEVDTVKLGPAWRYPLYEGEISLSFGLRDIDGVNVIEFVVRDNGAGTLAAGTQRKGKHGYYLGGAGQGVQVWLQALSKLPHAYFKVNIMNPYVYTGTQRTVATLRLPLALLTLKEENGGMRRVNSTQSEAYHAAIDRAI